MIQWDIKLDEFMDINLIKDAETALELFEFVDGILAAPPCTEFTVSCAWCWPQKDADGRTAAALELVRQVQRLADLFEPTDPDYEGVWFWAAENPVGRMGKLAGLDAPYYFNPNEFAGYLDLTEKDLKRLDQIRLKKGKGVTDEESAFVVKCNAYTKKTGLWGNFNNPIKKAVPSVKCSPQGSFTQRLGGKSERTKELRSVTPLGFARAFYEANKDRQWQM